MVGEREEVADPYLVEVTRVVHVEYFRTMILYSVVLAWRQDDPPGLIVNQTLLCRSCAYPNPVEMGMNPRRGR
jgi:hypothetical protein